MDDQKLIRPSSPITPSIARISQADGKLRVFFPEKLDAFREVVHTLSMVWQQPYYVRRVSDDAARFHLAAELAHRLLAAGFVVKGETAVMDAAVAGSYTPEPRRGVRVGEVEPLGRCFIIWWRRNEDLYRAAKSLPGARYASPNVAVPTDSFAAVRDFIQRYDLHVSDKALALLDEAEAEFESAIVVDIAPVATETAVTTPPTGKPLPLDVPETVEIDDDLADD